MNDSEPITGRGDPLAPLVTVGIFGYNQEAFIEEAVLSVLSQTHPRLEIFVVDDGSSDATLARLQALSRRDPRVRVVTDAVNRGLTARMNQVLAAAHGEWLAVLGGDDAFLPDGISRMVAAARPDVTVVWGDLIVMDESGRGRGYARPRDTWQGPTARKYRVPGRPLRDILRVNNFISGTSPMVRTSALRQVGGYSAGTLNEDLDLWLRLAPDHLFQYVDAPVARYRVVGGSSSRSEARMVVDQARIFRRLSEDARYVDCDFSHLLAMRWAMSVARSRGRPEVSLEQVSATSGIPMEVLRRSLPRAITSPLVLSAKAHLARRLLVFRRGDSGPGFERDSGPRVERRGMHDADSARPDVH